MEFKNIRMDQFILDIGKMINVTVKEFSKLLQRLMMVFGKMTCLKDLEN